MWATRGYALGPALSDLLGTRSSSRPVILEEGDASQASYSKAAAQSWLLRPGTTEVMAPALYDVYLQRWGDAALAAKRSKNQAATPHQVTAMIYPLLCSASCKVD